MRLWDNVIEAFPSSILNLVFDCVYYLALKYSFYTKIARVTEVAWIFYCLYHLFDTDGSDLVAGFDDIGDDDGCCGWSRPILHSDGKVTDTVRVSL